MNVAEMLGAKGAVSDRVATQALPLENAKHELPSIGAQPEPASLERNDQRQVPPEGVAPVAVESKVQADASQAAAVAPSQMEGQSQAQAVPSQAGAAASTQKKDEPTEETDRSQGIEAPSQVQGQPEVPAAPHHQDSQLEQQVQAPACSTGLRDLRSEMPGRELSSTQTATGMDVKAEVASGLDGSALGPEDDPFDFTTSEWHEHQIIFQTPKKEEGRGGSPSTSSLATRSACGDLPGPDSREKPQVPVPMPKRAAKEQPLCVLCVQPRANAKTSYCGMHKRSADNLQNQGGFLKKKYGEESSQYILWEQHWKNGSAGQRHKAIIKYSQLYGGKPGKPGTRKGELDFSQFEHVFRQSVQEEEDDAIWRTDFEVFQNKMKELRGWSFEQSQLEWDELSANDSVKRDYSGHKGARLAFCMLPPSCFLCIW